jgi:hypothetical protein
LDEHPVPPDRLILIRPTRDPAEFEALQLSRQRERGGDTTEGWRRTLARMAGEGSWQDLLVSPLQSYPLREQAGTLGLLRFADGWGASTVAALWTGQAGSEVVTLLYRCGLARENAFSATVSRLLRTLTLGPRQRERRVGTGRRAGEASPAVVFALNVVIALVLIVVSLLLRAR